MAAVLAAGSEKGAAHRLGLSHSTVKQAGPFGRPSLSDRMHVRSFPTSRALEVRAAVRKDTNARSPHPESGAWLSVREQTPTY